MINVFLSKEKNAYNINLDSVINHYLEEIANKYNVPFYQVDATCSMFMNMFAKYNKDQFVFDGKNDRNIIVNFLEACPTDMFVEHYYKTFMRKVINSNKFNIPVEGNKTLFAIIFKIAYKAAMFMYMFKNNLNGIREKLIKNNDFPICNITRVEMIFEKHLHSA